MFLYQCASSRDALLKRPCKNQWFRTICLWDEVKGNVNYFNIEHLLKLVCWQNMFLGFVWGCSVLFEWELGQGGGFLPEFYLFKMWHLIQLWSKVGLKCAGILQSPWKTGTQKFLFWPYIHPKLNYWCPRLKAQEEKKRKSNWKATYLVVTEHRGRSSNSHQQ